ncbi:hypothetical protein SAMN05444354_113161 [Stigmatella aurantiaca]|uniref:Uncharacterized protein n=1 Tax=Stigmatella aurantiaca TaxID=41 RepID=A0A1H7WTS4_STIAU|nr:hypothetical protein [Stigmatella aurantiaca]SEM24327.1 hypothetical protein SAMN05444354_113161 [Stigmatella aurantiaca]
MRPVFIALCLLTFAGASRAEAARSAVALIWKGSKDKAEAEAQKATWGPLEGLLEKTGLLLPEGHPRLVQSRTVPGLKPGFWVWLLGTCSPGDAPPLLERFQRLAPGTYGREVKVPGKTLACPKQEGPPVEARDELLKLPSGATLRVFTREEPASEDVEDEDSEGAWDRSSQTRYHFVLFGKSGDVVDRVDVVGDETVDKGDPARGPTSYRCDVTGIEASGDTALVLTRHCSAGGSGECGALVSADEVITVKVQPDRSVSASEAKRQNAEYGECG